MQTETNKIGAKLRSVFLVLIMVLSTTAAFATNASASAARNYTTNRDPIDIGIADFNCDGHNDICLLYTSPSPRDATLSRMPSSA